MKSMPRILFIALTAMLALGLFAAMPAAPAFAQDPGGDPSGDGVDPIFLTGNPSCATLNADNVTFPSITSNFGFKINGSPEGTFTLTNPPGELTGGAPSDPDNSITISNSDGQTFDWLATLGIDAVIVKGGPNADAFVYNPEDLADTDLHAPVNPANGEYYGISHIEFCYDYEVKVTKTAVASYDETHTWEIEKSVDPESQSGYPGDVLDWEWKVIVSESSVDDNFVVSGKIFVENPDPSSSVTVQVADELDDGTVAVVDCDPVAAGNQTSLTVAAGATGECEYVAYPADASATLNTATVTQDGVDIYGTADVDFVKNVIGGSATVVDDQIGLDEELTAGAGPWEFTGDDSHTCSTEFSDYGADGTYGDTLYNLAVLTDSEGNELSDDAETTYTCEAGSIELLKLTNGLEDAAQVWNFKLFEGPDGFDIVPQIVVGMDSTPPALMDFGGPALRPDTTYTVCELEVPAGWSSQWMVNGNIVIPYDPDADNNPAEDLGNRCVDFGAGTDIPVEVGTIIEFEVDNRAPGGDPRTPGYWKNWNSCTGGGQAATAAVNGGWAEGFWLLEDVLNPAVGGGIVWDDILVDDKLVTISQCAVAVDILDKREVGDPDVVGDGKKLASDPLHNLATHLLAAQLNFGAGACKPAGDVYLDMTIDEVANAAEELLDKYNFDGFGHDPLSKKSSDNQLANTLAGILDNYNNGDYCGSDMP